MALNVSSIPQGEYEQVPITWSLTQILIVEKFKPFEAVAVIATEVAVVGFAGLCDIFSVGAGVVWLVAFVVFVPV